MVVHWFRRDLRLSDNCALFKALSSGHKVMPIFIFDNNILDQLEDRSDARVSFIHCSLEEIQKKLIEVGSSLHVHIGKPEIVFEEITNRFEIKKVFTNHDYEPYANERDAKIKELLNNKGVEFLTFKDHVIFEKSEVMKDDGSPYTVYTPFSRKWKQKLKDMELLSFPSEKMMDSFWKCDEKEITSLEQIGFEFSNKNFPERKIPVSILKTYNETRDFPAINGTSRLGVHLRFGTLSIRKLLQTALECDEVFVNELIWRDFYQMILWHFPHTVNKAFKPAYDFIKWENVEEQFKKWCEGKTGYPLVDAGMRELNATGYMHNRVRMVVASFLCKHLLIDWRWGERYFAEKLLDFDLAANIGGWQWAAGSGNDAAPYFRVFNPILQLEKFDKEMVYVRKWVPEYGTSQYSNPIVEHTFARNRAIQRYKEGLERDK